MSEREQLLESDRLPWAMPSRLGLVVHPTRAVEGPLRELRDWADPHDVELVQVRASCAQQRVAEEGDPEACDLLVSIGGDGTTLAALRAGVMAGRPVLPAACGSLGVLTSVPAGDLVSAIERFTCGDWVPWLLPALDVAPEVGSQIFALNDIAIVRGGPGQVRLIAEVDGSMFARIAGDGCVVSTPVGSSAYTLAAGGPLLAPDIEAFVITALPTHGGSCPSHVVGASSRIRLEVTSAQADTRLELDGQALDAASGPITITFRAGAATSVTFPDQEPYLAALRKRQIITDSPRILAEDAALRP